jgi:hypothetical protein
MIYITGIDHLVQYNGPVPPELLEEFKEYIAAKIKELNITLIAEEFNEEFLHDVFNAAEGTAETAAAESGTSHLYCDPDAAEREALGIAYYADVMDMVKERHGISEKFIMDMELRRVVEQETALEVKKFWPVRERFWLNKLKGRLDENILFLCGHEHVRGFSELLRGEGVSAAVIEEFWRGDIFSDYDKLGLR